MNQEQDTAVLPVPLLQMSPTQNSQMSPVPYEQMSPSQYSSLPPVQYSQMSPDPYTQMSPVPYAPGVSRVTRQLSLQNNSGTTRALSGMPVASSDGSELRPTVVIKGGMKRSVTPPPPPHEVHKKRRLYVSLAGSGILFVIICLALIIATPMGHDVGFNFNPLQSTNSLVNNTSHSGSVALVSQATATAVFNQQNDGYGGGSLVTNGDGSLEWPLGQCTYWANYRYHNLTGFWVTWSGNADQWVAGARAAGWTVSTSPHIPSILVMMPGVQGASYYGHVAVVESIVANSSPVTVNTSNMNWFANGGGWDLESTEYFTVGSGIYFIWHS
jgi:surface antigen